jgi:hypothetical protein
MDLEDFVSQIKEEVLLRALSGVSQKPKIS